MATLWKREENSLPLHQQRLSEAAPAIEQGDAIVRSHGNRNHERLAEMTSPDEIRSENLVRVTKPSSRNYGARKL